MSQYLKTPQLLPLWEEVAMNYHLIANAMGRYDLSKGKSHIVSRGFKVWCCLTLVLFCFDAGLALADPRITGCTPARVAPGERVTISGRDFGALETRHRLHFGQRGSVSGTLVIRDWSDTRIGADVPREATGGSYWVSVFDQITRRDLSNRFDCFSMPAAALRALPPLSDRVRLLLPTGDGPTAERQAQITAVHPPTVIAGGALVLSGTGFGSSAAGYTVETGSCTSPTSRRWRLAVDTWNSHQVAVTIPAEIASGNHCAAIYRGGSRVSNLSASLRIVRPTISSYEPNPAMPGDIVRLRVSDVPAIGHPRIHYGRGATSMGIATLVGISGGLIGSRSADLRVELDPDMAPGRYWLALYQGHELISNRLETFDVRAARHVLSSARVTAGYPCSGTSIVTLEGSGFETGTGVRNSGPGTSRWRRGVTAVELEWDEHTATGFGARTFSRDSADQHWAPTVNVANATRLEVVIGRCTLLLPDIRARVHYPRGSISGWVRISGIR